MTRPAPSGRSPWLAWVALGAAVPLGAALLAAATTGDPARALAVAAALARAVALTVPWLAAAAGLGLLVRRVLPEAPRCVAAAGGAALMLLVDAVAARTGVLGLGAPIAWLLLAVPALAFALATRRLRLVPRTGPPPPGPPRIAWLLVPPLAVALAAALSAPGWLWRSEFGGYDVLSYHLQLPREWLAAGIATGLEHNVYAFLPSFMETAYLHLAALAGDATTAAVAAQCLHLSLVGLAAWNAHAAAQRWFGPIPGVLAPLLLLGTPWVVVVGTLAYNEGVLFLALAASLVLVAPTAPERGVPRAAVLGVLLGAACGAKPTAAFLVALPVALASLAHVRAQGWRSSARDAAVVAATALIVLLPWLLSNLAVCGNPVFPYLTGVFGSAHWSPAQVADWRAGHHAALSARPVWDMFLRFGLGPAPDPNAAWLPQWSVLPAAGLVAGAALAARHRSARVLLALLAVQIGAWLLVTHHQSRFLLPAAVPLVLLLARGLAALPGALGPGLAALLALAPAAIWLGEGGGRPALAIDAEAELAGEALERMLASGAHAAEERRAAIDASGPPYWLNHELDAGARILAVGEAAPFYLRHRGLAYATVWDRGPFSRLLEAHGDDEAALARALADDGWTHLLVDPTMLAVWRRSGWGDARLGPLRVIGFGDAHLRPLHRDARGTTLYAVPSAAP